MEDPNTHNRLFIDSRENQCNPKQDVTGSNPVTRSSARFLDLYNEDVRTLLKMLLTPEMRRKFELAQYTNQELLSLYVTTELRNKLHNKGNLESSSRLLKKYLIDYLSGYPPTELNAKSFLSEHFSDRKRSTFGKHYYTLNGFMKWIGYDLNMKVRIPRTIAKYNEPATIMQLRNKIKAKRTHKG